MTTATLTATATPTELAPTDIDWYDLMPNDGKRYELVDGELKELPPMRMSHTTVAGTITFLFGQHIKSQGLPFVFGPGAAFRLGMSGANFRIPDVSVTPLERISGNLDNEPGIAAGFPDIAVEVVSRTDTYEEVVAKALLYLERSVAVVLLVDLYNREVVIRRSGGAIHTLTGDDTLTLDPVLPGFSCSVSEIFSDLDQMAAMEGGDD